MASNGTRLKEKGFPTKCPPLGVVGIKTCPEKAESSGISKGQREKV